MTECTNAQEIISAASDGELHDAAALEAAKTHCRSCPECAAFVRTLAAIHRAPAPEMPAGAFERILDGVRTAYETAAHEPVAAAATEEAEPLPVAVPAPGRMADAAPSGRPRVPVWAPWAAAAAVLLVVAGVATTQGVQYLLKPSGDGAVLGEASTTDPSRESDGDQAAPEAAPAPPADDAATAEQGPAYVVFDQRVFTRTGETARPAAGSPIGSVTSALDSGEAAVAYPVYPGTDADTIVVATDDDEALVFTSVVRPLRGTPYGLRSGSISAFGQWPSLPSDIPEPTSPDGSPTFIKVGTDDLGVPIFVRPGTDPASGFAVAPGTAPSDPAAGNTGWTWWEPQR